MSCTCGQKSPFGAGNTVFAKTAATIEAQSWPLGEDGGYREFIRENLFFRNKNNRMRVEVELCNLLCIPAHRPEIRMLGIM
jgi:hypothetical protein